MQLVDVDVAENVEIAKLECMRVLFGRAVVRGGAT